MRHVTEGFQVALELRDPNPKSEYAPCRNIPIMILTAIHSRTLLRFTQDEKYLPGLRPVWPMQRLELQRATQ